jgi:hypothetical protein
MCIFDYKQDKKLEKDNQTNITSNQEENNELSFTLFQEFPLVYFIIILGVLANNLFSCRPL